MIGHKAEASKTHHLPQQNASLCISNQSDFSYIVELGEGVV
jgi:hypothetical protein